MSARVDDAYEKWKLAFEMHHEMTYHEMCGALARLRALVSWIDGQLVDEAPYLEIRAGIDKWRDNQK